MSRRDFCPVRRRKLSSFQSCFWPWCWGLDVRVPYHSGMTGTVRDITQTRVSHHSEPSVVGRRSCTGFPTQHWVDVPALLPLTHLQSWASYRTSVGLTFVTCPNHTSAPLQAGPLPGLLPHLSGTQPSQSVLHHADLQQNGNRR